MKEAVVMGFDSNYLRPAAATISSIGMFSPGVNLIVLSNGLTNSEQQLLKNVASAANVRIDIRPMRFDLSKLPSPKYFTPAAYSRLFIPQLCPDIERAVYLDADLIVRSDIRELFTVPLNGHPAAAARDPFQWTIGGRAAWKPYVDSLPKNATYFNSGVFVMDLEMWRKENLSEQCFEYAIANPDKMRLVDQDAINAILLGRIQCLESVWNVPPVSDLKETFKTFKVPEEWFTWEREAKIVHFMGPIKPWNPSYPEGANLSTYNQLGAIGLSVMDVGVEQSSGLGLSLAS